MLTPRAVFLALTLFFATEQVHGRERWLERDNRPVFLYPRRFGQEQAAAIQKLSAACPGEICGRLAGEAVTPLLAAQPECSQQDHADKIIDASRQFDAATQANMIAIAIEYRQAEKNTPPDFSTNPPSLRNSVFCQRAPRNPELNGLVQAQDPNNDPNLFFDPALGRTVLKGSQPNTFPFGGAAEQPAPPANDPPAEETSTTEAPVQTQPVLVEDGEAECQTAVTVTVTATVTDVAPSDAVTVIFGDGATTTPPAAQPTETSAPPSNTGNFGRCTVPEIEFGAGFDGRRETSFQPVDRDNYNHGSAQNINIITEFMCNHLTNFCQADQTAKTTCATARAAAAAARAGTGAQADAFNAVFGITTDFDSVQAIDNTGRPVLGTGAGSGQSSSAVGGTPSPTSSTDNSGGVTPTVTPPSGDASFGSCSVPEIEFGVGFDGRRETSFRPVDRASFSQGSAQNINIITRAICDRLTDTCQANQAARDTCAQAAAAASAAPAGGAQADTFNAAFGITTDFVNIPQVDSQGNTIGVSTPTTTTPPPVATSSSTPAPAPTSSPSGNGQESNGNSDGGNTGAGSQDNGNNDTGNAGNLQRFSENLGGVNPPTVTALDNGQFQVEGNFAINGLREALIRSCDVQNNQCANAANASGNQGDLTVANCREQQLRCIAAAEQTAAQQ
ncbi:hypothetical protein AX16_002693 [Volvariella volvacea WC 439]|nr:hypothetical protein AX16_002693 [Volvariella volvacea WC 439]